MHSLDEMTLGRLLHNIRKSINVSKMGVSHGLCDEQTYYRIENDIIAPDALLFSHLWERMGISLSRISIVLTESELEWYKRRKC